jgi:hypothetical protein
VAFVALAPPVFAVAVVTTVVGELLEGLLLQAASAQRAMGNRAVMMTGRRRAEGIRTVSARWRADVSARKP